MGLQRRSHKVMMSMSSENVVLTKRYARTMIKMHLVMADLERSRCTAAASQRTARSSKRAGPVMVLQHVATKTKAMEMTSREAATPTKGYRGLA